MNQGALRGFTLVASVCVALSWGCSAEAASPLADGTWMQVETPHFAVFSSAPESKTVQIATELERFRTVLEHLMPRTAGERSWKIPIFVFPSDAAFAPYNRPNTTGDVGRFRGYFRETRFGPVIALSVDARSSYRATVFHEAVHGYLREGAALPLWLEEGIAEYLSSLALLDDRVRAGIALDHHLTEIQGKPWSPLRWTLGLTGTSPVYNDANRVGPFYAYSWLVVHFLLHEGRVAPLTAQQLLDAVRLGGSPDGSGLVRGLDGRLAEYVKRSALPTGVLEIDVDLAQEKLRFQAVDRATMLVRLGELQAWATERLTEAEEHFREALRIEPASSGAMTGLSYVMERTGRPDEADAFWNAVRAAGTPDARHQAVRAWAILETIGRAVVATGLDPLDAPRIGIARRLLEQVVEADPQSGLAQYGLGLTYCYSTENIGPGIAPLERARNLLKGQSDIEANLAILYARNGQIDAAVTVRDGLVVRGVDRPVIVRVERAIADAYTQSVRALAERGDHHTAIEILTGALEKTTDPHSRSLLERTIEWLGTDAEQKALYTDYNRAVALANRRDFAEAYAILDDLVPKVRDTRLAAPVDDLHGRLARLLGKSRPSDD